MPYTLPTGILVYRFGERASGFRSKTGKILDYHKIKKGEGVPKNGLFEDINFPTEDTSIYFSQPLSKPVVWKRPHEIDPNPKFFVGGASRFDVKQGELGNCWFLAALANLTLNNEIFHLVVPEDNGDFDGNYNGAFHFRFWKFGKWVDVVIDDRLPTRNGQLVFMHSVEKNEFWSALLEKAYAKQHGSYEHLEGGNVSEALEDFTGGVTEMCKVGPANSSTLFQIMSKAFDRSSFMGCSLEGDPDVIEAEGPLGLIRGHAYSITDVKTIQLTTTKTVVTTKKSVSSKKDSKGKIVQLLRIRNPWGNSAEWKGAWSDGSKEWALLNEEHKTLFDVSFDADGEFWMSYEDFAKYFQSLDICNLGPDVLDELTEAKRLAAEKKAVASIGNKPSGGTPLKNKKWIVNAYEGAWVKGVTAGGCQNYRETFGLNPQYIVQLVDPDEEDNDDQCTLIVALMQKFRRKLNKDFLPIGFLVFHIEEPDKMPTPLNEEFFKYHASVPSPLKYTNSREVSCRFKLAPGTYCIVPSVFRPNEEGEFILRVFTETKNDMKENDDEIDVESDPDETEKLISQLQDVKDATKPNGETTNARNEAQKKDQEDSQKAQAFFRKLAGEDLEVNWQELKSLLDSTFKTEFGFEGFSKDICRSMIAMMDADRSGKLGFDEFQLLWKSIENWKNVFKKFDLDKSGTLSSLELRQALNSAGFGVNNHVLQALVLRYGNKDGCLLFDDFIMCAIKLKCMIEVFKERLPDGQKSAMFTLDDWVDKTLYS